MPKSALAQMALDFLSAPGKLFTILDFFIT